jgi:2-amino-4-hydroxy-6-hydroxymethyldihydropteridine diphosphokinase
VFVTRAYIGVGANLGDREQTIRSALALLADRPDITLAGVSRLRETAPWGDADQPRFLNGAAALDTSSSARELLDALLAVEKELGRTRGGRRYGPRTIDLDLLLFDDVQLVERGLVVPHPRLHERLFALEPLAELDPELVVPGQGRLVDLIAALHSSA